MSLHQLIPAGAECPLTRSPFPYPDRAPVPAPCTDANSIAGARILIAGDHGELRTDVAAYLARQNLSVVDPATRRQAIVRQIQELAPSLVLLRHAPQHADGLAPLRDIRARSDVPVIMITAVDTDDTDRILGLELGADDCLTEPFNQRELLARIRAVLRRHAIASAAPRRGLTSIVYRFSGWRLHQRTQRLINPHGSAVSLSKRDFALLIAFVSAPERVLTRENLIQATRVNDDVFDRSIDVQVHRLRRKLDIDPSASSMIETERGIGYRFCVPVARVALG